MDANACQFTKVQTTTDRYGVKTKKAVPVCGLARKPGSNYCPRHEALMAVELAASQLKDANRAKAVDAGVGGIQPNTRAGLIAKGFQFTGNNTCRDCGGAIEWWTTPARKKAPYDPMQFAESFARSHFATCPAAAARRAS